MIKYYFVLAGWLLVAFGVGIILSVRLVYKHGERVIPGLILLGFFLILLGLLTFVAPIVLG